MLPRDLKPEQFRSYPPEAQSLALAHLTVLRDLPLSFLPNLLREVIDYDYKFPAERLALQGELNTISALDSHVLQEWFRPFVQLRVSSALEHSDWINSPAKFVEDFSAYLWSTQQLDAFRSAATTYGERLGESISSPPPPVKRLGVAIIGQGVSSTDFAPFRKLKEHGTYFDHLVPDQGLETVLARVARRASAHPDPYAHWYIDGGTPVAHSPQLTSVSYQKLAPSRNALLKIIQGEITKPGLGPEELRNHLARLTPADIGLNGDAVLDHFQIRLLTEGSGTQIFSTTFAQWAGREALRRAQPATLLLRFAPRQRQRPMNDLLSSTGTEEQLDPAGSLVDADMAAYYQWINQQRLKAPEAASFVAWFESHSQAVAIGPSMPRGVRSSSVISMSKLLDLVAD